MKKGSPPQVRGKHICKQLYFAEHGITPAGAGKTIFLTLSYCKFWDHPRRCGENDNACACPAYSSGSPPQVRGKPVRFIIYRKPKRITPAGAGKTLFVLLPLPFYQDHPRRCGENRESLNYATRDIGSPPQVRGKPPAIRTPRFRRRITPAGAGKTL